MNVGEKKSLSVARIIFTMTTLMALSSYSSASGATQTDDCDCAEPPCGCSDCCDVGGAGGHHGVCGMPPHYMYFPQSHGNYYFRPYNYQTIVRQQQSVGRYGGDPRNPYDNTIFNPLYESLESGTVQEELAIPDPRSGANLLRYLRTKPASIFRDEAARPPKARIESAVTEIVSPKLSRSAFSTRLVSGKE